MYACMMTFFLSNTIESQLLASGAFEIFFNGKALCACFLANSNNLLLSNRRSHLVKAFNGSHSKCSRAVHDDRQSEQVLQQWHVRPNDAHHSWSCCTVVSGVPYQHLTLIPFFLLASLYPQSLLVCSILYIQFASSNTFLFCNLCFTSFLCCNKNNTCNKRFINVHYKSWRKRINDWLITKKEMMKVRCDSEIKKLVFVVKLCYKVNVVDNVGCDFLKSVVR